MRRASMVACKPRTTSSSSTGNEAPADPTSFEELFLDVHDRLYRALYFVTGSSADAEELMQDAFLKLWERWGPARHDRGSCRLFRVALNGVRMRARRARMAARKIAPTAGSRDPFDDVNVREDVRRMLRGISSSKDRDRAHRHLRIQLGTGRPHHGHPTDHRACARVARRAALKGS